MNFLSLSFVIFFVVFIIVYYVVPSRYRYVIIAIGSYIFYGFGHPVMLCTLIGTTIVSYLGGILVDKKKEKSIYVLFFALEIVILIVFKYTNFTVSNYNALVLKFNGSLIIDSEWNIILPIGLSFIVFQTCAYLTDVYRGRVIAERNIIREVLELDDDDSFRSFIELENEVLSEHHDTTAVHSPDEINLLHSRFPDNIKLFGAVKDDKMIAGVMIFEYENVVHTQYMAANDLARNLGALDLTVKYIIDKYKETKKWLDFGISTENDGLVLNEGLISQKEGFGGRTIAYYTWNIIING